MISFQGMVFVGAAIFMAIPPGRALARFAGRTAARFAALRFDPYRGRSA